MSESESVPSVSVVVASRNEAGFIDRCVRSLLANDYPRDRLELIVVDGMSEDGTADHVRRLAEADPRVRLVENPGRITPTAFNLGVQASRGDIVFIVGAHGTVARDYFSRLVNALEQHPDAWCAGGRANSIGVGRVGRAIAAAMTSRVGVGNAKFRYGASSGYVDNLSYCGFRHWVFDKVGLFDEELLRNQDDDMSFRIRQAGGKIWFEAGVCYEYYVRSSFRNLARQYYQYGFWRIRTIQKHRRPATLRQVLPLGFVLTWLALVVGTIVWRPIALALAALAVAYGAALLAGAVSAARRVGVAEALMVPLAYVVLHFGYGLGNLHGLLWFGLLRRYATHAPRDDSLSR